MHDLGSEPHPLLYRLGSGLEDAVLYSFSFDPPKAIVLFRLGVPRFEDSRADTLKPLQLMLRPVRRLKLVLSGPSGNEGSRAVSAYELPRIINRCTPQTIYGQPLFDRNAELVGTDADVAVLDWQGRVREPSRHTLDLSLQDDPNVLELRIWFDEFALFDASGVSINPSSFVAESEEWSRQIQATGHVPSVTINLDARWQPPQI